MKEYKKLLFLLLLTLPIKQTKATRQSLSEFITSQNKFTILATTVVGITVVATFLKYQQKQTRLKEKANKYKTMYNALNEKYNNNKTQQLLEKIEAKQEINDEQLKRITTLEQLYHAQHKIHKNKKRKLKKQIKKLKKEIEDIEKEKNETLFRY